MSSATGFLCTCLAGDEDGYLGIDAALQLPFREDAIVNVILVTDEDRDVQEPSLTYESTLNNLIENDILLDATVNAIFQDAAGNTPLGVDADGTSYIPDGAGGFTTGEGGEFLTNPLNQTVKEDYIDLVWANGGVAWDLNQLREGGDLATSFTQAFVSKKAQDISEQLAIDLVVSDPNVTVENLTGPLFGVNPGEIASFDAKITGDGLARSFELFFVRPDTGFVLGSIPVAINQNYLYLAQAVDPDGDPLTYLLTEAPEGVSIAPDTGLLSWTPREGQAGEQVITVKVVDGLGGSDSQSFSLTVSENQKPIFTSTPLLTGDPNQLYQYDVDAEDPEGTTLSYSLSNGAPDGMTIAADTGLIQWTPTAEQQGYVPVTVFAEDAEGGRSLQSFLLRIGTVDDGNNGGGTTDSEIPLVSLGFDSTLLDIGEQLNLQVRAVDDQGITSLELLVDGSAVALTPGDLSNGAINQATVQFSEPGLFEIVATAGDADGNFGTESLTVRVLDPDDNEAPFVEIDTSNLQARQLISTPAGLLTPEEFGVEGSLEPIAPNPDLPVTFVGRGGLSTDGVGTDDIGILQAEIPDGSTVEQAYLHVVSRTFDLEEAFRPEFIGFEGTEVPIVWLDNIQDSAQGLNFEVGRVDVTALVATRVGGDSGTFDFTVDETVTGDPNQIEGTSLSVIYSNPNLPERSIILLEGGLTQSEERNTTISFASPVDTNSPDFSAQLALGISYGSLKDGQFTTVDVNGQTLTSSAGDFDDGFLSDRRQGAGAIITVGGVSDSPNNPVNPLATDDFSDDELYDITSFLRDGDTSLTLDTRNSGDDDLLFLTALS